MDSKTPFLTFYLRSLAERTRLEKKNIKFGFDWVIYNLAIAQDLIPHRLPFFRTGATELSKPKTEAEFGIDASFLSRDRKTLTIFVLKDEVLTNATWTANDFDGDLRRAAAPDLTAPEFNDLKEVRVVLAYNKDEDQTGIRLYENLVRSFPSVLRDDVRLAFERWNLTVLTEKVKENLLNPHCCRSHFLVCLTTSVRSSRISNMDQMNGTSSSCPIGAGFSAISSKIKLMSERCG